MKDQLSDDSVTESNVEALMKTSDKLPAATVERSERDALSDGAKQRIRGVLERELAKAPPIEPGPHVRTVRRFPAKWKAVGAGAAVLAAAAGIALFVGRAPAPIEARHQNDEAVAKAVTLRDGTKVVLAPGAALVEKRPGAVELSKGRAVFDVGAKKAFALASSIGNAESTGGRFLASVSDAELFVAVARGKVTVDGEGDAEASVTMGNEATLLRGKAPSIREGRLLSHVFAFAEDVVDETKSSPRGGHGNLKARDPQWRVPAAIDSRVFDVDVVVESGFARTTIDQTYFNPTNRTLEGLYSFQVPHDATISRLAMYVDGTLMESAVVDRSRGRDIYEGIVERQRDPALLEWMGGDAFRMRLFPIPGRTEKRVFLSYTELLEKTYDSTEISIPVPDFDTPTRRSSIEVRLRGAKDAEVTSPSHVFTEEVDGSDKVLSFQSEQEILGKDIVVRYASAASGDSKPEVGVFEEGGETFTMVRFAPDLRATQTSLRKPRRWVVLFDVSGSRPKSEVERQLAFVSGLTRAIDVDDTFEVVAFAHDAAVWSKKNELAAFVEERALVGGDSRIDRALEKTAALPAVAGSETMLVYLGDGAFTSAGDAIDKAGLDRRVADLDGRFFGVGFGSNVDRGLMSTAATSSGGFVMALGEEESASRKAFEFLSRTVAPCLYDLRASSPDRAGASVMIEAPVVCDGAEVKALVKSPSAEPLRAISFTAKRGDAAWEKTVELGGASTSMSFLPRLHAEWRVKSLMEKDPIAPGAAEGPNQKEITELGLKHFLVTPFTSLLVLENDAMYEQYGVTKGEAKGFAVYAAPSKIPVVTEPIGGSAALAVSTTFDIVDRSQRRYFQPTVRDLDDGLFRPETGLRGIGTIGWGGLGLSGIGEGGGGRGFGSGIGSGAIRMGGRLGGGGGGFGFGAGRLGGMHRARTDESRVSTKSLELGAAARGGRRIPDFSRSSSQGDFVSWGSPVGDDDAWLRLAFGGARLEMIDHQDADHFRDLTEFARGLFLLPIDEVDVVLGSPASELQHDDAASALLARAWAKQAKAVLRSERAEVRVDGEVVRRTRRLASGLEETLAWDAGSVLHQYAELGFETRRELGATAGLVGSLEGLPVVPSLASLGSMKVSTTSPRTVRAELPVPQRADERLPKAIEWTFDEEDRLVQVRHRGGEGFVDQSLAWNGPNVTVRRGAEVTSFESVGSSTAAPSTAKLDRIDMPLRNAEHMEKWAATLDGEARVHALHQLLASSAATGDEKTMRAALERLVGLGRPLSRAEVSLGSLALSRGSDAMRAAVNASDPVGAYVLAFEKNKPASFDAAQKAGAGSFVGALSSARSVFLESSAVNARKRAASFVKEARLAPLLVLASMDHASRLGTNAQGRELWQSALAERDLGLVAASRMADSVEWDEPTAKAREAFEGALGRALERGLPISWDYRAARVLGYGFRQDALTDKLRADMLAKGTAEQLVEWMRMEFSQNSRDRASADPYARRLAEIGTDDQKVRGARILVRAGAFEAARSVLAGVLGGEAPTVSALLIGSRVAEAFGEIDQAIRLRERAFAITKDSPRDPSEISDWYLALIDLTGRRLAQEPADAARSEAVLAVAARWQAEEPDSELIAEAVAGIFFRAGKMELAEAAIASLPERRPADGAAWGRAARLLVSQGQSTQARALVDRAVLVEPTNPEWTMERARLSLSMGERDAAIADFQRVASGTWQPRFNRWPAMANQTLCDLGVGKDPGCQGM